MIPISTFFFWCGGNLFDDYMILYMFFDVFLCLFLGRWGHVPLRELQAFKQPLPNRHFQEPKPMPQASSQRAAGGSVVERHLTVQDGETRKSQTHTHTHPIQSIGYSD